MKAGTLLLLISEMIILLQKKGLITATGDFGDFSNITSDMDLVKGIEELLTQHGVTIPNRVDKVLTLIPLVVDLVKG